MNFKYFIFPQVTPFILLTCNEIQRLFEKIIP